MTYIKVMLTLLVVATAGLAIAMSRPTPMMSPPIAPSLRHPALHRTIDTISLKDVTAEQAIRLLREKSGVDIRVDWDSMKEINYLPGDPVNFSLQDVRLYEVLHQIFRQFSGSGDLVSYDAFDNSVVVWARGRSSKQDPTVVRVYDVRDLLSDEYWGTATPAGQEAQIMQLRLDGLRNFIEGYGGPQSDLDTAFAGRLVVTRSTFEQRKIANLLAWLRALR